MIKAPDSFKKRFSKNNLLNIYGDRVSKSGAIGIDRIKASRFIEILPDEISLIQSRVLSGSYRFTPYKEKLISKGASSNPRQISIPTVRDRITLRALCECLGDIYPEAKLKLPHAVIDTLKKKLESGAFTEYAKIDLQSFYPTISHKLVLSSTWKRIRKRELRSLILKSISTPTVPESRGSTTYSENKRGVPQGLAVSNLLAEISLLGLDSIFSNIDDVWYCRYVDDILILTTNGKAEPIAIEVISRLKKIGLSAHPLKPGSKTKIGNLTQQFSFLGYLVEKNSIRIRRESILRFESSIAKILTAYKHKSAGARTENERERALAYCRWKINLRITGCTFNDKRLGWVAYFSQITTTSQLRSVNWTISKLLTRFGLGDKIKPKSLIKTYYELRNKDLEAGSYIPNFDKLTPAQKRERLAMWLGNSVNEMPDDRVARILAIKITKAVKDLESDIAHAY
ncbi:reverse transcriptase domain-containing protein [Stenotrophomonas acidaminiphila]|uniref:reverse transcriptase domain-containing protein n=1 Tax=Stenotrophomonas acidaminiphila TaxID=128780 RepID=UPI002897FAD9|nr:reverse transcriptase domain-containing protein [Stenotrophomonas acidaminiphila]